MVARILMVAAVLAASGAAVFAQTARPEIRKSATASRAELLVRVEKDAEAGATILARRYAIYAARLDGALTEADQRELTQAMTDANRIAEPYRTDRALEAVIPEFNNRQRELVNAKAGPAWNRLLLQKFPSAERVKADFPEGPRRAAAASVLYFEFALGRTLRPPRTAEMDARDAAYREISDAEEAKASAAGEGSKAWKAFEAERGRLLMSAAFKREVLGRYVPLFASFVKDDPPLTAKNRKKAGPEGWLYQPVWGSEDGPGAIYGIYLVWAAAGVAALLGALTIPVWWLRRAGRRHNGLEATGIQKLGAKAWMLPEDLRTLELPHGMRPSLTVTSGVVMAKEGWVETTVTTHTTVPTNDRPGSSSTRVTSTKKDRLWVRTVEGTEEPWMLTGDVFPARPGQAVSWVAAVLRGGKTTCVLYNHATGGMFERPWVAEASRGAWGAFFVTFLWMAAWQGVAVYVAVPLELSSLWGMIGSGVTTSVVMLLVYVAVVRAVILGGRNRVWRERYRPVLLAWFGARGAEIAAAVRGDDGEGGGGLPPMTRAG